MQISCIYAVKFRLNAMVRQHPSLPCVKGGGSPQARRRDCFGVQAQQKIVPVAKMLRKNMTKEERHLWYDFLRGYPVKFSRQKVLGKYIADFYSAEAKLVIELDGSQHYEETGIRADVQRDAYLRSLDLTILRYSNADINQRFRSVCEDILKHLTGSPHQSKIKDF